MILRRCVLLLIPIFCWSSPAVAQDWPTYINETALRMPTGPGLNEAAFTTEDPEDKNYAWGDVDLDGDVDLVCVRKQPYIAGRRRNVLFMNEGIAEGHPVNGVLVDRTALYAAAATDGGQGLLDLTDDRDVVLTDVDGDGWLDIITTTTYGQGLPKTISHPRVYLNLREVDGVWQGFRYEEPRTPTLPMAPNFCGMGYGDVSGDGFVDLYHVDYTNNLEDRLWINDGTGHFDDDSLARMTFEMLESEFGVHAVIADMNGDGVMDVVKNRANGNPYRISISYNDPTNEGFFDAFETVYTGAPYYVEVADLNNDDRLDIVLQDDGIDRYYLNQGNGPDGLADFVGFAFGPQSNGFAGTMEIADLNNDGFIDVLITDESVNTVGTPCVRHLQIWRNQGDVPDVTFVEQPGGIPLADRIGTSDVAPMDLNGDGWRDLVIGTCSGTSVWISQPPIGVNYTYPQGLPVLVDPQGGTEIVVHIEPVGGALDPASPPLLHLAAEGGPFENIPLADLGGGVFSAVIGPQQCPSQLSYYLSAQLLGGGEFTDPAAAPDATYLAIAAAGTQLILEDDIEGSVADWNVAAGPGLTSGLWEQADPNGTIFGEDVAAPEDDASPGAEQVMAFVTENGPPGAPAGQHDVDGGATYLTTPAMDLQGLDAQISYARWFFSALSTPDVLTVEISNDAGHNWVTVEEVTGTSGMWEEFTFLVGQYVTPTADVRLRFTAADPDTSITEAGIDDLRVETFICSPACPADLDGDGSVGSSDLAVLLGSWGPDPDGLADLNGDALVNAADLALLLADWGLCP